HLGERLAQDRNAIRRDAGWADDQYAEFLAGEHEIEERPVARAHDIAHERQAGEYRLRLHDRHHHLLFDEIGAFRESVNDMENAWHFALFDGEQNLGGRIIAA